MSFYRIMQIYANKTMLSINLTVSGILMWAGGNAAGRTSDFGAKGPEFESSTWSPASLSAEVTFPTQ